MNKKQKINLKIYKKFLINLIENKKYINVDIHTKLISVLYHSDNKNEIVVDFDKIPVNGFTSLFKFRLSILDASTNYIKASAFILNKYNIFCLFNKYDRKLLSMYNHFLKREHYKDNNNFYGHILNFIPSTYLRKIKIKDIQTKLNG